jgi:hypothetical protein
LLLASYCWYLRARDWRYTPVDASPPPLSAAWWNQALVRNAAAGLSEITGQLYWVGIEPRDSGNARVWVTGAKGFLAYSDDNGGCWVRFEYDKDKGEFHEPAVTPCRLLAQSGMRWPDLVPTVFAAEPTQSSAAPNQKPQRSQPTAPSNLNAPSEVQQAVRPQSLAIKVQPSTFDFGDVALPDQRYQGTALPLISPIFTVTNLADRTTRLSFLFEGDSRKEFSVKGCDLELPSGAKCTFQVVFGPGTAGPRSVVLEVRDAYTNAPTSVKINASVHAASEGTKQAPTTGPSQEKPAIPDPSSKSTTKQESQESPKQGSQGSSKQQTPASTKQQSPDSQAIGKTTPPAPEAKPHPPSTAPDLLGIDFRRKGEMVSMEGLIWNRKANSWTWSPVSPGHEEQIAGLNWIFVGPKGSQWATETRIDNLASLSLPNVAFKCGNCVIRFQTPLSNREAAWAAGWVKIGSVDHGLLFRSQDGGTTWQPMTRGGLAVEQLASASAGRLWMWPPRWYLTALLLCIVLALPALRTPPDRELEQTEKSKIGEVEGQLSSDKPLEPDDLDVLGLSSIALGLSRFLRNKKTLPPLTVAINGEWGTGKSSLMNLLRCDLKSYGMCPVWFNAWHHQKEEHLLAALLQTVRLEAVPPLWNLLGIPFRWRLLMQHLRRHWPAVLVIGALVTFAIGLDMHLRVAHKTDLFLWIVGQFLPSSSTPKTPPPQFPVQGGLLAVIAVIGTLWKGLTAFGANPAALLASVAEGNKMKDLEAQTSFRQKFAVEFRDFTQALGPQRPLVIFIDDLDRCLPGNVRDVLEAVNFLVSSGDCFVVLGMDRVQVQRAVGLSFKEVAEEAEPKKNGNSIRLHDAVGNEDAPLFLDMDADLPIPPFNDSAETAREKRREFAQRYLEKLINLEVRVPLALDEKTKSDLFKRPPDKSEEPLKDRIIRDGVEAFRSMIPVALTLLLVVGAWRLSKQSVPLVEAWIKAPIEEPVPTSAEKTGASQPADSSKPPLNAAQKTEKVNPSPSLPSTPVRGDLISAFDGAAPSILEGKQAWPATWILSLPLYLLALFLLLVAQVVLTTRPGVETHDSAQFTSAMNKVWYPLVLAKQNTPRAAKRFVNRVRYLAMRQRGQQEKASWWEAILYPHRLKDSVTGADWTPIPEPLLVALAAIEQSEPLWIYDDGQFHSLVQENDSQLSTDEPMAVEFLEKCREAHKEAFPTSTNEQPHVDWKSLPRYRNTFLKIWPRVTPEETV